jgi:two-component system OmpR family sensor kinase
MSFRPHSLWGRLALWYTAVLTAVLVAFAGTIYLVIAADEAKEPPEVASLEPPDHTGAHVLLALAVALPVATAVAVGGGLLITRRALKGLDRVVTIAADLSAANLARRIPDGPGEAEEVQRLTTTLNAMLERLERSVHGMRRFTEDASHELRTPIAVLMSEIEVTLRRPRGPAELTSALESALEELARVGRLVDSLLVLARSDSGQLALAPEEIDAAEVVRRALDPYEAVAIQRGLDVRWACDGRAPVYADPMWLGRAVANLIDNAAKFTPQGGAIEVTVRTDGRRGTIVVADSGPGFPEADRERIFERFYRGNGTRGVTDGFGLGLALAREIARASGGELSSANRSTGGAQFALELPLRDA